jgi:reprolysin-like metallo-peptidase family M12B
VARTKLTIGAVGLAIAAIVTLDVTATSAPTAPAEPTPLADLSADQLTTVAEANGLPVTEVRRMARGEHFEVDTRQRIRSVEPVPPPQEVAAEAAGPGVPPGTDVFALHSRPDSNRTIYLDFTGHSVEGTAWNDGARIDAPAFDGDGNPGEFNDAEREKVYQAFLATAEDYASFDVDVTTAEPAEDEITRDGRDDEVYGTRAVITPEDVTGCGCGGQAYVGVFNEANDHAAYQPAWAYANMDYSGKSIAEIISHETGHNVGLSHDGQGGDEYYHGHENWGPIMGAGYYQPVTQWSQGEYDGATRTEDDLSIIPDHGVVTLDDDHADTADGATPLADNEPGAGIVATDSDVDVFTFTHAGGPLTVTALPAAYAANLDIRLVVRDADGAEIASVDPPVARVSDEEATGLDARFAQDLAAGTYTLSVEGVGFGDPSSNGYTGYASIGAYTLTAHSG